VPPKPVLARKSNGGSFQGWRAQIPTAQILATPVPVTSVPVTSICDTCNSDATIAAAKNGPPSSGGFRTSHLPTYALRMLIPLFPLVTDITSVHLFPTDVRTYRTDTTPSPTELNSFHARGLVGTAESTCPYIARFVPRPRTCYIRATLPRVRHRDSPTSAEMLRPNQTCYASDSTIGPPGRNNHYPSATSSPTRRTPRRRRTTSPR
jgi:hypothetical protein